MSEILKVKVQDENGNVFYIHTSADVVFCADGTSVQDRLGQKLDKSVIIQNATTAATDKVPSAAVVKDLQDQITQQNTKTDAEILYDATWNGLHIKIFRTLDGVFFGMRGTPTEKITAGIAYAINATNVIGELSGSFSTNTGKHGYISTTGKVIRITSNVDLSGWLIASSTLVFGL